VDRQGPQRPRVSLRCPAPSALPPLAERSAPGATEPLSATAAFGDRSRGMAVYAMPLTGDNLTHHLRPESSNDPALRVRLSTALWGSRTRARSLTSGD
jgi:hypothetical protein